MTPKRSPSSKAGAEPKRQRKMMTIAEKVKLLDMLKGGKTYAAVARQYGVNESTVRYIKKDEEKIRKTARITTHNSAKRVVTARNKTIVLMESALAGWIADCRKKNMKLNTNIIQRKAKSLYESFASKEPEDDTGNLEGDEEEVEDPQPGTSSNSPCRKRQFSASKGWFEKFQKRYGLKSGSPQGKVEAAETEVVSPTGLTLEQLAEICKLAKDLQERSQEWDDDMVRSAQFCNKIDDVMTTYRLLFNQKQKQCSFSCKQCCKQYRI